MLDPMGLLDYGTSTEINNSGVEVEVKNLKIMFYGNTQVVSEAGFPRFLYASFHNTAHLHAWNGKIHVIDVKRKGTFHPVVRQLK